jgi:hypothetical protein
MNVEIGMLLQSDRLSPIVFAFDFFSFATFLHFLLPIIEVFIFCKILIISSLYNG